MTNRTDHSECSPYIPYLYDYLNNNKDDIPESALKHIEQCSNCAGEVNELDTMLKASKAPAEIADDVAALANLELHFAYIDKEVGCGEVKPFLTTLASASLGMKIPTPITVHIDNCSTCSKDLQEIREMSLPEKELFKVGRVLANYASHVPGDADLFYEIMDALADVKCKSSQIARLVMIAKRPESGVRTCFSLKDEKVGQLEHVSEQVYDNWQIDVKVSHDVPEVKGQTVKSHFWRFAKPFAAVAAILMVAFILFNGPAAIAGLEKVYKTLGQVKNVYLKTISVIDGNVIQEVWVSNDLNVRIARNMGKTFLWEIGHERLTTREDGSSTADTSKLDAGLLSSVKEKMDVSWSLMPFKNMSNLIAAGAEWQLLTGTEAGDVPAGIDVYEVLWTETQVSGNVIPCKWRGIIDSKTSLPIRVEWWKKLAGDNEYQLKTATEVSYPDIEQVRTIINETQH